MFFFFFPLGLLNWAHPQFTLKSWLKNFWDIPSLFCTVKKKKINFWEKYVKEYEKLKMQLSHHKQYKMYTVPKWEGDRDKVTLISQNKTKTRNSVYSLNGWHYPGSQCFPNQEFKTSSFYAFHFPSVPYYLPVRKALLHRHRRELEKGGQKSSLVGISFLHCFVFTLPCLH